MLKRGSAAQAWRRGSLSHACILFIPMKPTIVELTDLPACDANISAASTLTIGSTAFVAYDTDESRVGSALLRFRGCLRLVAGGPNDEAFGNHPYYAHGLQHYALQEVVGSPWIREVSSILDRHGDKNRWSECRQFVLALKEDCIDVAAESAELVDVYQSHASALQAAARIVHDERD